MDYVVQKATELGVKRITPVITEYGVVKLDEKRAAKRREHWEHVATSACEQSGRSAPAADRPAGGAQGRGSVHKPADADVDLILSRLAQSRITCATRRTRRPRSCMLIGPEGGFSDTSNTTTPTYRDSRQSQSGPRVLRTETAAPAAALAIMQSALG